MSKKRLIIIFVSLFILFSLFSIVSSVNASYDQGFKEGYYYETHKAYYEFHYFNGTIVDKELSHYFDKTFYDYLIDVDGTTFYLDGFRHGHYGYVGDFNVGDKVTIYGNTIVEDRNMVRMDSGFNGKYRSKDFNSSIKFPEIWLGGKKVRLADGFVRGGSSSSSSSTSSVSSASSSSNKGISFSESKQYFPEASSTVREHVFDEADRNGDGYLSKSEYKIFKDVKRFTKDYANVKNNEYVETPDLWNGDGTTRTRYCADHGRVAVGKDNKCPWCKKYRRDPRTRVDSTRYV